MSKAMMACGHTASGVISESGKLCCAGCFGISPEAERVVPRPEGLAKREAMCPYCERRVPSDSRSAEAFFEYRPDRDFDSFYCGCRGWD